MRFETIGNGGASLAGRLRGVGFKFGRWLDVIYMQKMVSGASQSGEASATDGEVTRQFIALVMDHEGPFNVLLSVDGPLGQAEVEASVDATYDERPSASLMAVYLFPFVSLGAIWMKVLLRRRRIAKARQAGPAPSPPA